MIRGTNIVETLRESGFCHGVQAALDAANKKETDIQSGKNVYMLGDLVNNRAVMDGYRQKGFCIIKDINEITNPTNAEIIIRAHGVARNVLDKLHEKNIPVTDCTCPAVKRIHNIVAESDVSAAVLVVGKKQHPEVLGILGWCKTDKAYVIETEEDLLQIDWQLPLCVVGQTTCSEEWWLKATAAITEKQSNAKIHQTLCHATITKAHKATELAKNSHTMIVIGDTESANSTELYLRCARENKNTIFVSSFHDFLEHEKDMITSQARIGIVGSTSSPIQIAEEIHSYLAFSNFLHLTRLDIEARANEYFSHELGQTKPPFIQAAIEELSQQHSGGKCLRGALISLGEIIAAGQSHGYLDISLAYEIFQTAILIHDDMIDASDTRRGKTTIHAKYDGHYGIQRGICIGDYGLFTANRLVAGADISDQAKVQLMQQFADVQLRTLEGEIMDVVLPQEPIDPWENFDEYMQAVTQVYRYKTAWYTLAGPLMIGAICGGAKPQLLEELQKIAIPLGVAFQIKDDVLGMYASSQALGKPATSDMQEKKQTMLYGYAVKHATNAQKTIISNLYGKQDATEAELQALRSVFETTGALEFCHSTINDLAQDSLRHIDSATIAEECKQLLRGLVSYLIVRKK